MKFKAECVEEKGLLELLSEGAAISIRKTVANAFVEEQGHGALFWWEHFYRDRPDFLAVSANEPLDLIREALPSDEILWLISEGGFRGSVFEGTASAVIQAVDQCYLNEYYIAPHSLKWLMAECHEAFAYAIGEIAVQRLQEVADKGWPA